MFTKLAVCFTGAFKDLKPPNWCLTEEYLQYTQQEDAKWVPDVDYYMRLVSRLVDSIHSGSPLFAHSSFYFDVKYRIDNTTNLAIQYNTIFVYFELTKRSSTRETQYKNVEYNTYI